MYYLYTCAGKVKEAPCNYSSSLDADKVLGMNEEASVTALKWRLKVSKEGIFIISGRLRWTSSVLYLV